MNREQIAALLSAGADPETVVRILYSTPSLTELMEAAMQAGGKAGAQECLHAAREVLRSNAALADIYLQTIQTIGEAIDQSQEGQ